MPAAQAAMQAAAQGGRWGQAVALLAALGTAPSAELSVKVKGWRAIEPDTNLIRIKFGENSIRN